MADPCQAQRDAVGLAADKLDAAQGIEPPQPSKIQAAKGALAGAKQKLVACEQAHADAYVATAGIESDPALAVFDKAMQQFMVRNHVGAGQLCVLNKGWALMQRGYAYPATAPHVEPSSLFRIASISKMFTSAAIKLLEDRGDLKLSQPAFALIGITQAALPSQKVDPRVKTITVDHLLTHTGGWNDGRADPKLKVPNSHFDPVFEIRKIANDLGLSGPPSKRDLARYMFGQPLQFAPGGKNGAISAYSNFGYVLLGLIIEEVSGMPFIDFVRDELCKPLGIRDVYLGRMLAGPTHPREVSYDAGGSGLNALEPHANISAPTAYGGDGFVTELMDSGGGLIATATALAFFAHSHAAIGYGGRMNGGRSGGMAGTMSLVETRDDIEFAYIFNAAPPQPEVDGFYEEMNALFDKTPLPEPQIHLTPVHA